MRQWTRRAWICCTTATVLSIGLFVAYLMVRTPVLAGATVLTSLSGCIALSAVVGAWLARQHYRRVLRDLGAHVAALRANPSPHLHVAPDAELGLLYAQLEALAGCYRQALGDLVRVHEQLDSVQSLLGR